MNNLKEADLDFLRDINKKLLKVTPVSLRGKRAEEEAKKIVSTIPALMRNYLIWEKGIRNRPVRLNVYSCYRHELITGNELFDCRGNQVYTQFKKGSVGFYLCRYLFTLGFNVSVWCDEVSILLDSPRSVHFASERLKKPKSKNVGA